MALMELDGTFVTVNDALGRILGLEAQLLSGLNVQQFTHPDDHPSDRQILAELQSGVRHDFETVRRAVHHAGHEIWVDLHVTAVTDDAGAPAFFVAQVRDVTQATEQAAQLEAVTAQLHLAVNATQDGLWDWQPGQAHVNVTRRWNSLMDRAGSGTRVPLRWWWRRLHPDDRALIRLQLQEHHAGTRPQVDVLHRVRRADGSWRWLALRGRFVSRVPGGAPTHLAGALTDVDERVSSQQDLQVLLNHLPAMIGYWDADLHNRFGNRTYLDWFGKRADLMPGRHMSEIIGPDTYERNRPFIEKALRGEPQSFERRITGPDGRVRETHLQYIPDVQGGEVRGFYALGTDITEFRRSQAELDEHRELSRITLESIGDGVITTNAQGQVTFMNPVAQRLTGWREQEALGRAIETVLPLTDARKGRAALNPLRVALRDQVVVGLSAESTLRSRLGTLAHIEDSAAPIFSRTGELLGGVVVFHDVTEKQLLAQRMSHLARHDHLTGLPNRATLHESLSATVVRAAAEQRMFGLLFLDLDEFKQVNDTLGHALGDDLLRQVATRLQLEVRGGDVVARQGGDEFLVLLPEEVSAADVQAVGQRLLRTLSAPYRLGEQGVTVTCSVGAVLYPQDGADADTLIRHADTAMYHAKAAGSNCLRFYDAHLESRLREEQVLLRALKLAVQEERFHLVYQPQINARTGQLTGVEALLRWTTGDGESLPPGVFIPLAERAGLMVQLGSWVLRAACRQARQWQEEQRPTRVAVNVSAVQFMDSGFVGTVRDILRASGLRAELLELELTESFLMQDVPRVQSVLHQLKALGVSLSIDDFGTGYSSLSYLQSFPIDTLKIDRSFMPTQEVSQTVLNVIVGLGQALGLQLVAEGVETAEQRSTLLDLGCEVMQGYLYARPMTPEQLDWWWAERTVPS
ncbi:hypothetical protein GCM10008960_01210 [Deinococcus sedimenti]|uniref:EAL domain-containing protein n=2 Tax=Deinococcus sedimenti TaxID=1867090 RepID=A0ABQ2S146_9DEIO|nr:hypothetical protein GCM10008960_01210 [Deinococcus sedimenti]